MSFWFTIQIPDTDPQVTSATDKLPLDPSTGIQVYDMPDDDGVYAVWQPVPNVGSEYIVSGEAVFIDDMPRLQSKYL